MTLWGGVDVGVKKGFHVAVVDEAHFVRRSNVATADDVVGHVRDCDLVAVDSPRACAGLGERTRECERLLAHRVCGIRWTPDEPTVRGGNPYYEWIVCGLELYAAFDREGIEAVECFPTASWTRWGGARSGATRARWSARVLAEQGLLNVPTSLNQDWRDAIGAALTARAATRGLTEPLGEIFVPLGA